MKPLPQPPLLLITDRSQARLPSPELVAQACAAGCRWVSLREKDLAADTQIALAQSLKPIARHFGARLTLHGEAAIAEAAGLDGVHLAAGGDWARARTLLGIDALVGVSIHGAAEATKLGESVDYAIAGPVFETASKPGYGPALGLDGLAAICRASPVPVIVIGGIEAGVVPAIMRTGAASIAVMGSVMRAAEPGKVIKQLLAALAAARAG